MIIDCQNNPGTARLYSVYDAATGRCLDAEHIFYADDQRGFYRPAMTTSLLDMEEQTGTTTSDISFSDWSYPPAEPQQNIAQFHEDSGAASKEGRRYIVRMKVSNENATVVWKNKMDEVVSFLVSVYVLASLGRTRSAMDLIMRTVNDRLNCGDTDFCDNTLRLVSREANLLAIGPTLVVSFLTITLAAKGKLRFRKRFFSVARDILLNQFGETRTRRILVGLE